jgi:hypothetical protein
MEFNQAVYDEKQEAYEALKQDELKAAEQQVILEQQQKEEEATAEKERKGINDAGDVVKEIGGSVAAGATQAVSDLITTPERVYDLFKGDIGPDYQPDWDPLRGAEERMEPRTWWGNLLKEGVSLASVLVPFAGVAGKVSKGTGLASTIGRGAAIGTMADLVRESTYTQDPIAVQTAKYLGFDVSTDNPLTRIAINVLEGMGIGVAADALFFKIFGKAAPERIAQRNADVAEQTVERGKQQLKEPGFGGFKNKPIADQQQGNAVSRGLPSEIIEDLNKINKDVRYKDGSTDAFLTPAQIARSARSAQMSTEVFQEAVGEVISDSKIKSMLAEIKKENPSRSANELMVDVLQRLGADTNGRIEAFGIDEAKAFLKDLKTRPRNTIDGIEVMRTEDILAADVILGSLQKVIRDMGIAAREVGEDIDVYDKDGIMDQALDMMKVLLFESKRARRSLGLGLRGLRRDDGLLPIDDNIIKQEVNEGIDFLRQLIKDDPSGDLAQAITEFNSMGGKISNYEDLDNYARRLFKGFSDPTRQNTGLMIRELNSMMVHSVLSSPKTPARAVMGTTQNVLNREMGLLLGGLARVGVGDTKTVRIALAELYGMGSSLPEAWKLFRKNLSAYWSNDTATFKNRYANYERSELQWKSYGDWVEARGSAGEKAAYYFGNAVRAANSSNLFTYSSKLMAATDDAFKVIVARGRARAKAYAESLDNNKGKVNGQTLKEAEDRFYKELLDANGNINLESDLYLKGVYEEATLTAELAGFPDALEKAFETLPILKPLYLFARTGVNGLAMNIKNTPVLGMLMTKQRRILLASPDNLEKVAQYGITNAQELASEKALIIGRQGLGTAATFTAVQKYMADELHGNGPQDRSKRQAWIDSGWRPREIKIGGVWVSTSFFEPYTAILDSVADLMDNQQSLGERETESGLQRIAMIIGQAAFDKSYLSGLSQLFDVMNGEGSIETTIASNMNNQMPWSSLRNDIGKLFIPHLLEHNRHVMDVIRDRNRIMEPLADNPLPAKFDILTGEPIRDANWATRVFNMFSPVSLNLDYEPGRQLVFNSNYDLRTSVTYSPRFADVDGINLRKHPVVRSKFMKAIGDQNLLAELNKLAKDPKIQNSVAVMQDMIERGRGDDVESIGGLYHNQRIKTLFDRARDAAWASIVMEPEVQQLIKETKNNVKFNANLNRKTSNPAQEALNSYY